MQLPLGWQESAFDDPANDPKTSGLRRMLTLELLDDHHARLAGLQAASTSGYVPAMAAQPHP